MLNYLAIVTFEDGKKRVFETVSWPELVPGDMVVANGKLGTVCGRMTASEDELGFISCLAGEELPFSRIEGIVNSFKYEEDF